MDQDREPTFFDDVVTWDIRTEHTDRASLELRIDCVKEEYRELMDAIEADDPIETADACADLIWVVCGLAHGLKIPLNEVWAEVLRSNNAKILPDGSVIRRPSDGKIVKPEGWTPPDIAGILSRR